MKLLKKILIRSAFVIAALVTILALVQVIENFRGKRAWAAYEQEARSKGTKLDILEFVSPPVPDAENYAAAPLFQRIFAARAAGGAHLILFEFPHSEIAPPARGSFSKGQPKSLTAWRDHLVKIGLLSAPSDDVPGDILRALHRYDDEFAELQEASKRPKSHFPVEWEKGFSAEIPHLSAPNQIVRVLTLRMSAHLAQMDSAAAYEDLRLALRLYDALRSDPVLISGLIRVAVLNGILQPVWEGLADDQWADPELAKMEKDFLAPNLVADLRFALSSERGGMNRQLDVTNRMSRKEVAEMISFAPGQSIVEAPSLGTKLAVYAYPQGWLLQNQVLINQLYDEWLARIDRVEQTGRWEAAEPDSKFDHATSGNAFRSIYYVLARMVMPAIGAADTKFLMTDIRMKQAATACALQSYRHAKGSYPEKLEELVPTYLQAVPGDLFAGKPLSYRRDSPDRFTLWSVGLNRKDDGGQTGEAKSEKDQADLVWPSAAVESAK